MLAVETLSKYKAIVLDADGVTITPPRVFSERLAIDFAVDPERILEFFKTDFEACLTGKSDLKQAIAPYLPKWGWKGSMEELLNYWFSGEDYPNKELLESVQRLRAEGVRVCLASNQEKYRANYIKDQMHFNTYFDRLYFSCELGVKKPDLSFFELIQFDLSLNPAEIFFADDSEKNVEVATKLKWATQLY